MEKNGVQLFHDIAEGAYHVYGNNSELNNRGQLSLFIDGGYNAKDMQDNPA